jgi:PPOX class probable F420-dependent enzyme
MVSKLSKAAIELINGKNFAHLATLMRDGSPHVTPVWIDHDGEYILVNTASGRTKQKNVKRDARVALDIIDQSDPYHAVYVRGRVVAQTIEGAEEHIDKLAKKYLGKDRYPWRQPSQKRVLLKIKTESVTVA